jgi:hypothetical protein
MRKPSTWLQRNAGPILMVFGLSILVATLFYVVFIEEDGCQCAHDIVEQYSE